MPVTIDIRELPARFYEALTLAATDGEVILVDGSTPRARLIPFSPVLRMGELHPGAIQTAPDFDAPLPEEFWNGTPS